MDHLLNWLWQGSAVALAALVALRVLRRPRAQARHAVCAIALLAVLALPAVPFLSFRPAPSATRSRPAAAPTLAVPGVWWASSEVIAFAWSLWFATFSVRTARALVALRRARRTSIPFSPAVEAQLPCWTAMKDRGRQARLAVSEEITAAAVLPGSSPIIAVAPALVRRLSLDELDRLVMHEWAHVQRRDDAMNAFQVAVLAVAGWHPAVFALERQLRLEREVACDELAVAVTGCPKRYAACLAAVATLAAKRARLAPALGALSSPALGTRIARILSQPTLASRKRSAAAAVALAMTTIAWSLAVSQFRPIGMAGAPEQVEAVDRTTPIFRFAESPAASQQMSEAAIEPEAAGSRPAVAPGPRRSLAAPSPVPAPMPSTPERPAVVSLPAQSVEQLVREERLRSTPIHAVVGVVQVDATLPFSLNPVQEDSDDSVPPWEAAAEAGVAIGRGSQKAGVAVATLFSRFGRHVARSF